MSGRPVALVTGGSRGIGRAVVLHLAERGYDVSFCYQSRTEAAAEVAAAARRWGGRVDSRQVDVADPAAVSAYVRECERDFGPVEALAVSAGVVRDGPAVLLGDDDWQTVLRTNLDGTFHVCRAVTYGMLKRRRGAIVTISSVSGVYGNPGQSNYSAAKAGIGAFTKALAKEVGPRGIRANTVAPGFIDTDMVAGISERVLQQSVQRTPLGRIGRAEEVADLVGFLLSDRAAFITAQVIGVDGGLVC